MVYVLALVQYTRYRTCPTACEAQVFSLHLCKRLPTIYYLSGCDMGNWGSDTSLVRVTPPIAHVTSYYFSLICAIETRE